MFSRTLILVFTFCTLISIGASPSSYLYLFESAKERATVSLTRQVSRRKLALEEFRRAAYLYMTKTVTLDEYEQLGTAVKLSELDLKIAEIKGRQATLSLNLAQALARNGKPIPLCKRKVQKDENTVTKYLKKQEPYKLPQPKDSGSGTRVEVEKTEPPQPPTPPPPVEPVDPPSEPPKPPPIVTPIDPDPPVANPPPKPPGSEGGPKPPPGNGGGTKPPPRP